MNFFRSAGGTLAKAEIQRAFLHLSTLTSTLSTRPSGANVIKLFTAVNYKFQK